MPHVSLNLREVGTAGVSKIGRARLQSSRRGRKIAALAAEASSSKCPQHFDFADNTSIELFQIRRRNPILSMLRVPHYMHFISLKKFCSHIESQNVSLIS